MNPRPLAPAVAGLVALAATAAAYHLAADPDPARRAPADPGHYLAEPPDPAAEAHFVRSVARDLVAREVIAGRATVPEAATVFGWLDARPPRHPGAPPAHFAALAGLPGPGRYTPAEMLGVRVVALAGLAARGDPSLPPGCGARARGEFLAARARGEFARLPTVPDDRCARLLGQARDEAQRVMAGRPPVGCNRRTVTSTTE